MAGWWATKVRQTVRHVGAHVSPSEHAELQGWLSPSQYALFESMHPADRRHGLDVVAALRRQDSADEELLLAGLLHDCSKGRDVRLRHRVAWALAERYGEGVSAVLSRLPGFAVAFERLERHAEASAELALGAGCSERTAELIRHQADPVDPVAGRALLLADEAS